MSALTETPEGCARLARSLMERAEQALGSGDAQVGGMTYDRLVAAAQVWATLATVAPPLTELTATLDAVRSTRIERGALVVLAHKDEARLVLDADALGTVSEVEYDDDGEPTEYAVVWHDEVGLSRHKPRSLVAVALP